MKKNLRTIPHAIRQRLRELGHEVIAACVVTMSTDELGNGALAHLGIGVSRDGTLILPAGGAVLPPTSSGKHSTWNAEGHDVKRTDLAKEQYTVVFDSPNFGDAAKYGSHRMVWHRERYPIEHIPAQASTLRIEAVRSADTIHILAFAVDEVLAQNSEDFDDRLLRCLNLLQENVGSCGVEEANVTLADYKQSLSVAWEILPPGTATEVLQRLYRGRQPTPTERKTVEDRHSFLMSLKPQKLVYGMSGISRYFGALIRPDLVVFENMAYGNAVYIMYDNWETLSQKSRTELLKGRISREFERVPHRDGWKTAVRYFVKTRLQETDGKKKR